MRAAGRSSYTYDEEERITGVTDSVDGTTTYTYDAQGQLLTETKGGTAVSVTYDNYGNILTKGGVAYTYGDANWKDKLTEYDGQPIAYDAGGNPLSYRGWVFTWEKGRQLKTASNGSDSLTFKYNASGIRTSKTVNGVEHKYILDGAKILRETYGSTKLDFLYDNEESICGLKHNGTPYYFCKNLQGDVIAVTNSSGQVVARYSYDAWGVCTDVWDASGVGIASINPFRYRGYYWDATLNLYYLQSRYFDPVTSRILNADDAMILLLQIEFLGINQFSYCNNNPIMNFDPTGHWTEYWGTFTLSQINSFCSKLDNKANSIRNKFWWVKWAGFALGIVVGIITGFFLTPVGGVIVGAGVSLATMGIEKLIDLYPSELNTISRAIRNAYNAIKNH